MTPIRRAVIDVGTNSVKVLVADVAGREVSPVWEESQQTRLGRGFYEHHRLQAEPISATAQAVARFAGVARSHQAKSIRVIATSAARDAVNAAELTGAIEAAADLPVQVISGEQEAAWAFQGVTSDPRLARQPLLLLDVGGGSTEFIVGRGEEKHFSDSFRLGTVRLLEQLPHSDPPLASELAACRQRVQSFLRQSVRPRVEPALRRELPAQDGNPVALVGTGGTASILGCMEAGLTTFDRERLEATSLSLERVQARVEMLWRLPLAERRQVVGLPANRADVILTGVAIYESVMTEFGFQRLRVSTRGLRFAAVAAVEV